MTYAQFRRMKPKYKRRLFLVILCAAALAAALLFGASKGVQAIRAALNTTTIKDATAANVLEKANMNKILEIMGQEDASNICVLSSEVKMTGAGAVTSVTLDMTNIVSDGVAESWRLTATEKKARLYKSETRYENLKAQNISKMDFKSYYPALSRVTSPEFVGELQKRTGAGDAGIYTFVDDFGNNRDPEYDSYLSGGLEGIWVSNIGKISSFEEGFVRSNTCAPTRVTVEAVDTEKSKGKRVVLLAPEERFIVLFEAGNYQ